MNQLATTTILKTSPAMTVQFESSLAEMRPYEWLVASRYLRHMETSKEIIQECLLASWERLRTAWLHRHNVVLEELKSQVRNTPAPKVKDTSSNPVKIGRALPTNHPKDRQAEEHTEAAKEKPMIPMSDR